MEDELSDNMQHSHISWSSASDNRIESEFSSHKASGDSSGVIPLPSIQIGCQSDIYSVPKSSEADEPVILAVLQLPSQPDNTTEEESDREDLFSLNVNSHASIVSIQSLNEGDIEVLENLQRVFESHISKHSEHCEQERNEVIHTDTHKKWFQTPDTRIKSIPVPVISGDSTKPELRNKRMSNASSSCSPDSLCSGFDSKTRTEDDYQIERKIIESNIANGLCAKFTKCIGFLLKLK